MFAIEFHSFIKNGSIEIPEEHKNKIKGSVRVILLAEEKTSEADFVESLLANPVKLPGFVPFTREEAHGRD